MILKKKNNDHFKILSVEEIFALPDPILTYPISIDDHPVKVQGEALKQIWWQGKQWAVTEYGIECRDGTYTIKAKELTYDLLNSTKHGWIEQMLSKGWCDMYDFRTAYFVALSMHGYALSEEERNKLRRHFIKS